LDIDIMGEQACWIRYRIWGRRGRRGRRRYLSDIILDLTLNEDYVTFKMRAEGRVSRGVNLLTLNGR